VDCPGLRWGFDRLQYRNVGHLVLLDGQLVLLGGELLYHGSELIYAAPHEEETEFKPVQLRRTCSRRRGPLVVKRRLCRRDGQQPGQRRSLRPNHLHCFVAVGLPCQRRARADQNGNEKPGKGTYNSLPSRPPFDCGVVIVVHGGWARLTRPFRDDIAFMILGWAQ
jgi:hypothetical protein